MKFKTALFAMVGAALVILTGHITNWLVLTNQIDNSGEYFPLSGWAIVGLALAAQFPGFVVGWFCNEHPILPAALAGFVGGAGNEAVQYLKNVEKFGETGIEMYSPTIGSYLGVSVGCMIGTIVAAVFGAVVYERLRSNHSLQADPP